MSNGKLVKFEVADLVLVDRKDFYANGEVSLRWKDPRRVVKSINDYVYQIEVMTDGIIQEAHAMMLKFYRDAFLNHETIMSHIDTVETRNLVHYLVQFVDDHDDVNVQVLWCGLLHSKDTLEGVENIFKDFLHLLLKLLATRSSQTSLVEKVRRLLKLDA